MIGLFDSGSGGLTILSSLKQQLPQNSFLYLGDHNRAPYGARSESEILEFTIEMTETLFNNGANLVLLACNTASAVALRDMQTNWLPKVYPNKKVLGVLVPMVEKLTEMPWQKNTNNTNITPARNIGVFATPKTIESGGYSFEVKARAPNINIISQPCPGLVEAIEGQENTDTLRAMVKGYIDLFIKNSKGLKIDWVILGCTHYPYVEYFFREYLPRHISILSQGDIISVSLKNYLEKHPELDLDLKEKRDVTYLTTGEPDKIFNCGKSFIKI